MSVYKLVPIDIRNDDPKWAASTLGEPVWVEAPDKDAKPPPAGKLLTAGGKTVTLA
jgi:hypothetical protein